MKLEKMLAKVRKKTRDVVEAYWDNDEIIEYLNDAGHSVAWKSKCITANTTFETVEDTDEYSMSDVDSLLIDVTECWFYVNGETWDQLDYKSRDTLNDETPGWKNVDSDIPDSYYFEYERDKTLALFPAPDSSNAGAGYCEIYYAKDYTEITDVNSSPSGIPHALQLAMIDYAIAECLGDRGYEKKASEYFSRFNSRVNEWLTMRHKEQNDEEVIPA